ncbi:MAG: tRNA uridine-5-carboxymethylaminomethyl(34) synthesis GTPase MnmE, partial [Planctomycetes bacterium]|nr:tRNA uridine-5-carboxymethylaminomethyl(34) synthesis GTPase MnmE [Planctomycetota bacterium]
MAAEPTLVARATPPGGESLVLRLSGPQARAVAAAAQVPCAAPWRLAEAEWPLPPGPCPVRTLLMPGPRSATGWDVVEITLPGSGSLAALALARLEAAGAQPAPAGGF